MNLVDSLVRPAVTIGMVTAQIALAVAWAWGWPEAEPAFAALGAFTMMVVTFWFKDRSDQKATAATVAAVAAGANPPEPPTG